MQNWKYFQNLFRIVLVCTVAGLPSEQRIGIHLKSFVQDGGLDEILADNEDNSRSFTCDNGKRIQSNFKCDEDDDCGDRSDEKDCFTKNCAESEFRCNSGKCIRQNRKCNGHNDCRDGSDEASCRNCSSAAFTCTSGQCVLGSFQCNSRADCIDGSDENCPEGLTPSTIQEYWHSNSENHHLARVFSNDDIGVYFDSKVDTKVNWFFHPFSEAWKYIKTSYGPIGTNPILYLVLHEAKVGCATSSFLNKAPGHRTLLECGPQLVGQWTENTVMFETLFSPLGIIIREGANANFNNADTKICEDKIKHIFFYDIYIHLKDESSAEVLAWEARTETESLTTVKGNKRHCFRDWFLPIYKQFGKGKVLNNYLQNTKSYWPVHRLTGYAFFKLGEWVHFWSGSAGMDLQPMALKAFTWTTENQKELTEARQTYRALRYNVNSYTLAYDDNNIAFKFKTFRNVNNDIYQTLSNAWKYMKLAYNPRNKNPKFEIILEDRSDRFKASDCTIISKDSKPIPSADERADKQLKSSFHGYIMKCGKSVFQNWDETSSVKLDDIIIEMAKLALTHILGTDDPAVSNTQKGKPAQPITTDLDLEPLMVYDIYMELGRAHDAERWALEQSKKINNFPERSTHLFRDWYLEIYKRYDTRFLKVVKEFVLLVNGRFNSTSRRLNVGEFVHFWSGAINENLIDLAVQCFTWNAASIKQFNEAHIKFPGLDYDCYTCDSKTTQGPQIPSELEKGVHTIAIAVGVSATILVVAFICFGIKYVTNQRRIQKLSQQIRYLTPKELDEFHLGNPNSGSRQAHAMIHSLPFKNEFEVPRERLVIDEKRVLGSGAFGIVKRGLLLGDEFLGTSDTVVAVKAVKQQVDVTYFKAQLLEIKIMAYLGKHDNIASLLATVTTNIIKCEVLFALEFCAKGDLYQYLNKHRQRFTDLWSKYKSRITPLISSSSISCGSISYSDSKVTITPTSTSKSGTRVYDIVEYRQLYESSILISTLDLLTWSRQIACGMEYLGLKEVIHGDLAARNVLLTENNVAKVSDFGLSRQLVNYSHYQKTSNMPVPWRWLAIESLTKMTFSLNSDVWSFGVTLWELFTLGNVPYMGKNWDKEFVSELTAGLRLDIPEFGNQEIYQLMMNCMKKEPAARMPFSQIGTQLEKIKSNLALATAKPSTSSYT